MAIQTLSQWRFWLAVLSPVSLFQGQFLGSSGPGEPEVVSFHVRLARTDMCDQMKNR